MFWSNEALIASRNRNVEPDLWVDPTVDPIPVGLLHTAITGPDEAPAAIRVWRISSVKQLEVQVLGLRALSGIYSSAAP